MSTEEDVAIQTMRDMIESIKRAYIKELTNQHGTDAYNQVCGLIFNLGNLLQSYVQAVVSGKGMRMSEDQKGLIEAFEERGGLSFVKSYPESSQRFIGQIENDCKVFGITLASEAINQRVSRRETGPKCGSGGSINASQ